MADEPTGDLDRASADTVLALLNELAVQQNKTIVMVTHDQELAQRAQRNIHVLDGRVDADELTAAEPVAIAAQA